MRGNREAPRWLDEGIAVLSDAQAKQAAHARDLLERKETFPVGHLLLLDQYPSSNRIPAFYGQSASLTALLGRRDKPSRHIAFANSAADNGYDQALRKIYQINGVAQLHEVWRNSASELNGISWRIALGKPRGALVVSDVNGWMSRSKRWKVRKGERRE